MNENLTINKKVVAIDIVLENCQGMHFSIDDFISIMFFFYGHIIILVQPKFLCADPR